MLSSYAISVLVLYLFCTYDFSIFCTNTTNPCPGSGAGSRDKSRSDFHENEWTVGSTSHTNPQTHCDSNNTTGEGELPYAVAVRHLQAVHPLDVLRAFLKEFAAFSWDRYLDCVSCIAMLITIRSTLSYSPPILSTDMSDAVYVALLSLWTVQCPSARALCHVQWKHLSHPSPLHRTYPMHLPPLPHHFHCVSCFAK